MPMWVQIIIASAAVVTAAGVLWARLIRPAASLIAEAGEMLPVLRDVTEQLKDVPDSFQILKQIIAQFRTDSGSSLRDVVDRLEAAAEANRAAIVELVMQEENAARHMQSGQEAQRILAQEDRVQIATLLSELRRVNTKVDDAAAGRVVVAGDLEAAHARAEAADDDAPAGEAADAAMIRPTDEP